MFGEKNYPPSATHSLRRVGCPRYVGLLIVNTSTNTRSDKMLRGSCCRFWSSSVFLLAIVYPSSSSHDGSVSSQLHASYHSSWPEEVRRTTDRRSNNWGQCSKTKVASLRRRRSGPETVLQQRQATNRTRSMSVHFNDPALFHFGESRLLTTVMATMLTMANEQNTIDFKPVQK